MEQDGKGENGTSIIEVFKKRKVFLTLLILSVWFIAGIIYFVVPREYETSFCIEYKMHYDADDFKQNLSAKSFLESYNLKTSVLDSAGIEDNTNWYMKRILVYDIKNTNMFRVVVRGKSQEESLKIANAFLLVCMEAVQTSNQKKMHNIEQGNKNILQFARQKALEASAAEKEVLLIEYSAIQQAFQNEYARMLMRQDTVVALGKMDNIEEYVFPTIKILGSSAFFGGAILAFGLLGFFYWYDGKRF